MLPSSRPACAPVTPQDQRSEERNRTERARELHVGKEDHRTTQHQGGNNARLRAEEILAGAVDPGEGQHAAEEGQGPNGGFAPANDATPNEEQFRPALGLGRVGIRHELPDFRQRSRPRIVDAGSIKGIRLVAEESLVVQLLRDQGGGQQQRQQGPQPCQACCTLVYACRQERSRIDVD